MTPQTGKQIITIHLNRFEANIVDWPCYNGVSRVVLSQLFSKAYMIQIMDFVEQLCFCELGLFSVRFMIEFMNWLFWTCRFVIQLIKYCFYY